MADWKRIACGVDLSHASRSAMEEAAAIARRDGAELTLLYVYEPPPDTGMMLLGSAEDAGGGGVREIERPLAEWREEAERIAGRPVSKALLIGVPASEIVRFAQEHRIDLVVVATHGRKGLAHLVLGSVAEAVLRQAPCSVLVVRRRPQT
jgi:universal stress protein A